MELKTYLKSCSKVLFKKLCELSNDKRLINYYEEYDRNLNVSFEVDFSWALISTALLLSENMWENESVYKSIPDKSVENIIEKSYEGNNAYKGEQILINNCLLDHNNVVANPITINEIQAAYNLDVREMTIYRINRKKNIEDLDYYEKSSVKFLDNIFENDVYGANQSLITNNELDYRKFIIRVRHALAHSNYEILDNGYIRLYHYNLQENKLDFNVAVKKNLVLTILDELNELYYIQGKKFAGKWNDFRRQFTFDYDKELDENLIIEQLSLYKMFTVDDCKQIIEEAKRDEKYDKSDSACKLDIIYDCFLERIRPVCSYGIITNEILYGNNNGLIDEEFYSKFYTYNYFNSELFDVNMNSNSEKYNKHIFGLLLFSFLNCMLLNSVNINNSELLLPINFSEMNISAEYLAKAQESSKKLENDINNQILRITNELNKVVSSLNKNKDIMKVHGHINNNYYQEKLPLEIFNYFKKEVILQSELKYLKQLLQCIDLTNISNYILIHLRNSLAHGYIKIIGKFDLENISEVELEFADYNPSDKSEQTFKGSIKLGDLLAILTDKKYIENVVSNKKRVRNK